MVVRGDTNILKVYDLTDLIDINEYDLDNLKEIDKFKDTVASYIDSGEAEALSFEDELIGIFPESFEIQIDDKTYSFEDINYKNRDINTMINEKLNENDVICILKAAGEGYFEYEQNPDIRDIQIGFSACDIYEVKENVFEFFCDLILPFDVNVNNKKIEVIANNFYPKDTVVAGVYTVKSEKGKKYLQKVCEIDLLHFNWDELEDIIQINYDE